ncbi:ABC transporter substrate-binding protein [Brucella thiophenivorans]|uniref:Bacterial extracellular solute-binding, 5 Middle family protein n=1 Tax=Brucella thiophenivorans TaxID=571255 RepID=A0A256F1U9_9HYPH|nr:ABC transporter substrate-binding protein [Brucella thiophenivorans]OYR08827.1 bacterial extracellular solute-binding, 5 Middle family protein [Brucella thiophenivorans]
MSKFETSYENLSVNDKIKLDQDLRSGASRRDVLKMLLASGLAATAAGSIVTNATRAYAQTPKKGGKVRVATYASSTADTLDPARAIFNIDYIRVNSLYSGLTRLDDTLTPQMELAESFETNDAKKWVIKLRKGATFHDGSDFTADDVVFSLQRHKDPATASSGKSVVDQIKSITKTSDYEVTIELNAPNADLPALLGTTAFLIVKNGTDNFNKGIGTGAFKLTEFSPGTRSLMVANENYWKQGSGPYVDQIEIFAIQDETARLNALLAGDVDIIANVNPRATTQVTGAGHQLLRTVAGQYTNLIIRLDQDPGVNFNFVQAMKHLVNRDLINKAVFRGFGQAGNDQPISPSSRFYRKDLMPTAYDPEKAKSLLADAGLIGKAIPIVASTAAQQSVEIAMVLQQAASQIGLTLDVQRVPSDGYWSNYWNKAPICFGNINPRPTPDAMFSQFYKSDAAWNESKFKDEKFDALLTEARGITDDAKRMDIYGELQGIISTKAGTIIPSFYEGLDAHNSKVKGIRPMPSGNLMGNSFAEYIWLDEA